MKMNLDKKKLERRYTKLNKLRLNIFNYISKLNNNEKIRFTRPELWKFLGDFSKIFKYKIYLNYSYSNKKKILKYYLKLVNEEINKTENKIKYNKLLDELLKKIELNKFINFKNKINIKLNKIKESNLKSEENLENLNKIREEVKEYEKNNIHPMIIKEGYESLMDELTDKISNIYANISSLEEKLKENSIDEKMKKIINFYNNTNLETEIPLIKLDNGQFYTINDRIFNKLRSILKHHGIYIIDSGNHSDPDLKISITDPVKDFELIRKKRKTNKERENGGFFKYYLKEEFNNFNFNKYGIFNEQTSDEKLKKEYSINCLIRSFKNSNNFKETKINELKIMIKNRNIPMKDLKIIANKLNVNIKLRRVDKIKTKVINYKSKFQNKKTQKIEIGILDKHYFLIDKTNYTKYSIENNDEVKNIKDFNKIYKKDKRGFQKSNKRYIDSFKLIQLLLKNKEKYLKKIELTESIMDTTFYDDVGDEINDLNFTEESSSEEIKYKEKEINEIFYNQCINKIFFDCETINSNNVKAFMISALYYEDDQEDEEINLTKYKIKTFKGLKLKKLMYEFLDSIKEDSLLIAHNLSFDYAQIFKGLFNNSFIKKGSFIKTAKGIFYNRNNKKLIKLRFVDSYGIITKPLRKFKDMFNLDVKKEIMPYNLYTRENIKKDKVLISEALNNLDEKDHEEFKKIIKDMKLTLKGENNYDNDDFDFDPSEFCDDFIEMDEEDKYFNHMEYAQFYCEQDCRVLFQGYMKFKQMIKESINFNIDEFISAPQLANKFLTREGCYDGCYKISGIPRAFIQKCVIGGRVMCRNNKKSIFKDKILNDFDAVSLYPSAMVRMGFLKGTPKILRTKNYEKIKNYDGYFVEIIIDKINKKYNFPLINYIDKNGIRQFNNNIENIKNRKIIIDKITLEDWIKYQKIEFKILRGYYFNEGRNYKIKTVMRRLFNERLKMKKEENQIQEVYKLIMNSAYGKTIMKPIKQDYKMFDNEEKLLKYLEFNYNKIDYFEQISGSHKYILREIRPILDHFSSPHIGSEILSMSKRIMNEVMCLAEDLDINMYYTDTDSIHIEDKSIELLEKEFYKKYNKKLIGKDMGQFHCDFDDIIKELKTNDDNQNKKEYKADKVYAIESIFLGKKSYIDKLCLEKNGKKYYKYHIRMKGIPSGSIKHKCETLKINPIKLFEKLYNSVPIEFDLLYNERIAKFKITRTLSYIKYLKDSGDKFTRTVRF